MARAFRHRPRTRHGERGTQGVVFNANYLAFFDVVITEFWREAIGQYNAMIEAGADMVVAESRIRFLGSAVFDEELDFELRVARLGNTALGTQIDARVGDRAIVAGEMRHVFIDPATKEKRPMPDDIRTALEPYAVTDGERDAGDGVSAGPAGGDVAAAPAGRRARRASAPPGRARRRLRSGRPAAQHAVAMIAIRLVVPEDLSGRVL